MTIKNIKNMVVISGLYLRVKDLKVGESGIIAPYRLMVDEEGSVYLNMEANVRVKPGFIDRLLARDAVWVTRVGETEFEVDLRSIDTRHCIWQTLPNASQYPGTVLIGKVEVEHQIPKRWSRISQKLSEEEKEGEETE